LILEHLKRNLSLNGFTNVRLINVAAWNKFEDLPLFHSAPDNLGETTVVSELATKSNPDGYIKGAPLEALLLPEEVVSAGLVKIDVEGAEYQVVEGMLNLLPRFPKDVRFLMELKPNSCQSQLLSSLCASSPTKGSELIRSAMIIGQSSTKTGSLVASQNRLESLAELANKWI